MQYTKGNSWISSERGVPSCATPQHSFARSSAVFDSQPEVASAPKLSTGVPLCVTPQHRQSSEVEQAHSTSARKRLAEAAHDAEMSSKRSKVEVGAFPLPDVLDLQARLATQEAAALATRRQLEEVTARARPEGSVFQKQSRSRLSSAVQDSLSHELQRSGFATSGLRGSPQINIEQDSDNNASQGHIRSQVQQQQQHVGWPAPCRPASANSTKQPPASSGSNVRQVDYRRSLVPRSELRAARQLPATSQGYSSAEHLFAYVRMAPSPLPDGLEVHSRKELLEEFLWKPETEEEQTMAGLHIPCPFLRELGACDRAGCLFNHSGIDKPCHRLMRGLCNFGSGCLYYHRGCHVPQHLRPCLTGWASKESELATTINNLWSRRKLFV